MSEFLDRLATIESSEPEPKPKKQWDADLIPDLGVFGSGERDPIDAEIDALLGSITIDDAYTRWCGKSVPKIGRKRESVMVSCPVPGHGDKHPSAWLNLDKGVWFCGTCGIGGDQYDIAAYFFGYDVPDYKVDSFPQLREKMAENLGLAIRRVRGERYVQEITEADEPSQPESGVLANDTGSCEGDSASASVTTLRVAPEPVDDVALVAPTIDWHSLLPPGTFWREYMQIMSTDDSPEEYHFWNAAICVSLATGHEAILLDKEPVHGNLFVCLYGTSGSGKSRSTSPMQKLLRKALPYNHNDDESTGTHITPVPGSAEALIDSFSKPITGEDAKDIIGYAAVRGLVRFDELAGLIGRGARSGSVLKSTLQELYDSYGPVEIKSRTAGVARAENHFCCVLTTTQPGAVRDLLVQADADSGFINRIVFAAGPKKPRISYGGAQLDIDPLVKPLARIRQWTTSQHPRFVLEGEAFEVWDNFFQQHIEPYQESHERSLMTRADLTLKKLILLFCANEESEPTADLVNRALKLFEYLESTYRMLTEEIGIGQFEDCRLMVGKVIRQLQKEIGGSPSTRQINRAMPRRYQRDLLLRVLDNMQALGEVTVTETKAKHGPPLRCYAYAS